MKSLTSRQLAIYMSLFFTLLSGGVIILFELIDFHTWWIPFLISVIILFSILYLIIYFILKVYIYEKILPIYKSIHVHRISQKELRKEIAEKDIINLMNKEVEDWAQEKTNEIKDLKQLEKYRRNFIGNIMHELKTPIFNIQGYILTLLDGGLEDSAVNRLYLQRTEKSVNRMISIVEDLESISRLESGGLNLNMEVFDLVKLVEDIFEMQEMRAKNNSIKLSFSANYNKPVKVIADRKRIHEVLNNLVNNSINYGSPGGKTKISFMDMGENILIDISDNGIGISEKDLPRIFERFYRTEKSRSRDHGGTGLGLAIVKHILEAHNQTITVRSIVGEGSSFAFTLKKA